MYKIIKMLVNVSLFFGFYQIFIFMFKKTTEMFQKKKTTILCSNFNVKLNCTRLHTYNWTLFIIRSPLELSIGQKYTLNSVTCFYPPAKVGTLILKKVQITTLIYDKMLKTPTSKCWFLSIYITCIYMPYANNNNNLYML